MALSSWTRRDGVHSALLLGFIALLHVAGFGMLLGVVGPHRYTVGNEVFGVGLGLTAYTYGMRHAFDVDHIAAIDNTTRRLRGDGQRPKSVGFWFAMGHSATVFALAVLVALGAHVVTSLSSDASHTHRVLSLVSTIGSGSFLFLIGLLNLVALAGIWRVWCGLREGRYDEAQLETQLASRGLLTRLLGGVTRAITRPVQMFAVGMLFGIGFDTASEVSLLVLAGSGAAAGVPWYAIIVLPLLFAAGMSLLDCLDGLFMSVAYDWAFMRPVRKVYYNLAITGLSVAVAFLIGTIELVTVLHDNAGWTNGFTDAVSGLDLNHLGFVVVGLFVLVWAAAVGYWKLARVQERWTVPSSQAP
ncbi:MAG: HoxN/HupN/NixA family nickel/cobalt transporter [Nocardioidaceae bacterium]